jgi:hypothetical protein
MGAPAHARSRCSGSRRVVGDLVTTGGHERLADDLRQPAVLLQGKNTIARADIRRSGAAPVLRPTAQLRALKFECS